mmetsp:Transcript_13039/g.24678  ORF Transcript_13039/g.24678 Transcript_13039/m.24678 type:complete len:254 (-) Transcript_13039:106-867(-)
MSDETEVVWSGVTRGALLGDILRVGEDNEGLIFGTMTQTRSSRISDDPTSRDVVATKVNPRLLLSMGKGCGNFYDGKGQVDVGLLSSMSKRHAHAGLQLIGWWRLRNNVSLRPSLRDFVICKSFQAWRVGDREGDETTPSLFGLFGAEKSDAKSIHSFTSGFFVQRTGTQPQRVKATTPNMMQSSQSEYRSLRSLQSAPLGALNGSSNHIKGKAGVGAPVSRTTAGEKLLRDCLDRIDASQAELVQRVHDEGS